MMLRFEEFLTEMTAFRWSRRENDALLFFKSGRGFVPFLVVVGNQNGNNFDLIKINSTQFMKNYHVWDTARPDTQLISALRNKDWNALKALQHTLVKVTPGVDRRGLYDTLVRHMGMAETLFKTYFFDPHPHVEEAAETYKNAKLIFPRDIKPNRKEALLHVLANVDAYMSRKHLGYLISEGKINFLRTKAKIAGFYDPNSRELRVSPSASVSMDTTLTLAHELAHKLQHEYMSGADQTAVNSKYGELRRARHVHVRKKTPFQPRVGMTVTYHGRKQDFKKYSPLRIISIDENGRMRLASSYDENRGIHTFARFTGTIDTFAKLRGDWAFDGVRLYPPEPEKVTDTWFVSAYAETKPWEWFAELFSWYIMDRLQGEPHKWIDAFLGPYKR